MPPLIGLIFFGDPEKEILFLFLDGVRVFSGLSLDADVSANATTDSRDWDSEVAGNRISQNVGLLELHRLCGLHVDSIGT